MKGAFILYVKSNFSSVTLPYEACQRTSEVREHVAFLRDALEPGTVKCVSPATTETSHMHTCLSAVFG